MKRAILNDTTRIIRTVISREGQDTARSGESTKDLTDPEFAIFRANPKSTFVEVGGLVRAATPTEAEAANTVRQYLFAKIKAIAVDANKVAAYQLASSVLLAMANADKPGAIACVNASAFSAGQKTTLIDIINRS